MESQTPLIAKSVSADVIIVVEIRLHCHGTETQLQAYDLKLQK